MNDVDYPFKLNDLAIELNLAWMDPWFRTEISRISEIKGLDLKVSTRKLLQFYRSLEDAVEEEAVKLGLVTGPKYQGTNLTVVAPDLPTYLVVKILGNLIETYQNNPSAERKNLQQKFAELKQIVIKNLGEGEYAEFHKLYCSNYKNVTSYNWLSAAAIANRLYQAQIDWRRRLGEMNLPQEYAGWVGAMDDRSLQQSLHFVAHEMLSTLIGHEKVHATDYDRQIDKRLVQRFDSLLLNHK